MRSILRLLRFLKKNAFSIIVIFYLNKKKRKKSKRSRLRERVTMCKLTHF